MKNTTKKFGLILSLIILIPLMLFASSNKYGTTAANFLKFEVSARTSAMGGAALASVNDASAVFYNSALLIDINNINLTFNQSSIYADISHSFFSFSYPFSENTAMGIMVDYVAIGTMEETTLNNPQGTGNEFDASSMAIGFAFSQRLTNNVSVGMSIKYLREQIWLEYASGYAFDLSSLYRFESTGLAIAMDLSNIGGGMRMNEGPHLTFRKDPNEDYPGAPTPVSQYKTDEFPLPLTFSLGLALDILGENTPFISSEKHNILIAFEIRDAIDEPLRSNIGCEYAWNNILYLRSGYRINYDISTFSAGFGLNLADLIPGNLKIDYSWIDYGDLNSVSMWSIGMGF